jgi:ABC-2 type transport system ATP-binding protein
MESIVLDGVHKCFRRGALFQRRVETHALKGISLSVAAGEVLGLLGPNGSGKSTTLKLISTMLLPDRGRVLVHGFETCSHGQEVRKRVGFALASERSFFPRLTVRENLEFFAALEDIPNREIFGRTVSVLQAVDLSDAAGKQVMKLSSGMHQRLGIARALIKQPSVLLLDEPTRSLDAAGSRELWRLLRQMSAKEITILLATHNFDEAAAVCDRVVLLQRGKLIDTHRVGMLSSKQLRDFYFDITSEQQETTFAMEVPA